MKKKKRRKIPNRRAPYLFLFVFLLLTVFLKLEHVRSLKYLQSRIAAAGKEFSGDYSIIIYKPGFPELEFLHNPDEQFAAASLIKVPILAAALKAVKNKYIDFGREVTVYPSDVAGGSGIFKRIDLPYCLNFKELLAFMVIISDNTATNKVIGLLGIDYINNTFGSFGLTHTDLSREMMDFSSRKKGRENYTSARDIVRLLKMLYFDRLVDKSKSYFARDLLLRQCYNDRIAKLLPAEVQVAHKTGLERGVVHDAGIVYGKNSDFIIAVLTKNVKSCREAKNFIARVSFLAYNFFNN